MAIKSLSPNKVERREERGRERLKREREGNKSETGTLPGVNRSCLEMEKM
jgi:hypothetical protein